MVFKGKRLSWRSERSFTLIELLIVIGILAVLVTVAVLIVNPAQLFAQARDSQRLTELQAINRALGFADLYALPPGSPQTVYVSIPDASPTCAGLTGLPALAPGWNYACSTAANFRKVDGTGWIPINFASANIGIFSHLPIDPTNTIAGSYYYTYTPGGSWVLTAGFESAKYISAGTATADTGADPNRLEIGTDIALWSQSGAIVGATNTPPTANAQSVTTAYNTPINITLSSSDTEQCDVTFTVLSAPANGAVGSITSQPCVAGTPNLDSAVVTYTPNTAFSGSNSFTFRVNDGTVNSNIATISITVSPQTNTLPTVAAKSLSATTAVATPVTLTAIDSEQCDLAFSIVASPTHGSVGAITNQACASGTPNSDSGVISYTSVGGYSGSDSFTYKANDGVGDSNIATVSVTVSAAAPTATSASPSSRGQGATSQSVTITGTNFVSGGSLASSFSGTGITVNSTTFVSATQLTANITVGAAATTGLRTITVTNGDGQTAVCTNCFTVNASPTISSPLVPATGAQGATVSVTVNGTGFVSGATTAFSGTGITVNSTTFVSATQLTANITIAGGASATARDITVTNPDAGVKTSTSAFTVTLVAPTATSASPNNRGQGATSQSITLTGTGFTSGGSLASSFSGTGITVNSTTFVSATSLTANITVAAGATTGLRTITVTSGDGQTAVCTSCFTVNASPNPTLATPSTGLQGATVSVSVTGTGFVSGATTAFSGTGITVNSTTFVSATQLTVSITIAGGASATARDITVTNPDAGVKTYVSGFTVTAPAPAPTVTAINPTTGVNTGSVSLTSVTGTGFVSGATVKLTKSAQSDINCTGVTFSSATTLTGGSCPITGAATGLWNVVVTNPDAQTGTLSNSFTVTAAAATYTSCKAIKDALPASTDGTYSIKPDANPAFDVYCDMTNGGWTRIATLNDNGSITNEMLNKGITFNRIRAVKATDHSIFLQATFTATQNANRTANGDTNLVADEANTYVKLYGSGAYGVWRVLSGSPPLQCNWSNVEMMGAGYSGTCGSDVNLQVGYANGVNANLSTRYNVELYVMNSAAIAAIPTHYYALDEASGITAIDSIGGVNGTLGGSPARVAGYSGNALSFNGSNYVTVPGNLGISSAMTISFWVKPNVLSAAMAAGFIGGGGSADATVWVGGLNVTSGIGFHQNSCGQETGAVLSTGSWQHVVITKHTGLIASYTKIYLDGVEKATSNYYGNCSVYIASNRFNIGAGWAASNTDYGINGLIDEVRIYNYALSPAEVALIP